MSELDEKLKKIIGEDETTLYIHTLSEGEPDIECIHLTKEGLEQIKQAFVEDGWVRLDFADTGTAAVVAAEAKRNYESVMTGQDWYNRFEKELDQFTFATLHTANGVVEELTTRPTVFEAAKRAAGIES